MVRSRARLTSAGSTAYNQETLVIPLSSKTQPCRRTDGHDDTLQNPHPIAASSSSQPQQNRQQAKSRGPPTANLSLVAPTPQPISICSRSNQRATRPNLHSLNSWPAVQCNEGFCNASEGQRLPLTTTMASQKPHHSANGVARKLSRINIECCCRFRPWPPLFSGTARASPDEDGDCPCAAALWQVPARRWVAPRAGGA